MTGTGTDTGEAAVVDGKAAACYAVIVTYNSALPQLRQTLQSLAPQVAGLVVVDNSPPDRAAEVRACLSDVLDRLGSAYEYIANGRNLGIAAAQNIGIERAIALGAAHVIFSDHDTQFPPRTVAVLLAELAAWQASGHRIAAIGPAYVNIHEPGHPAPFFIRHEGFRFQRVYPRQDTVAVGHLIASGMIVPRAVLQDVGGFAEGLFIDWVDIEWCLRAEQKGYEILGCGGVCLKHALGDRVILLGRRYISIHSPFRHYHMVRNALFLARSRKSGPFRVRVRILYSAIRFVLLLPFISEPPKAHAAACLKGLIDGAFRKIPL